MRRTHGGPSGPSGHKPTKFEVGRFVGWDGEGATAHEGSCDGTGEGCGCPHRYVYMANSEGGELVRPDGISTVDALRFLTAEAARIGPDATHVCFGLSYDANMILGDVERKRVETEQILHQISSQHGTNFAALAKRYSEDPGSKDRGGYLSTVGRGQYVAPFETAGWELAPGGVSGIVRSPFGFHVIRRHRSGETGRL